MRGAAVVMPAAPCFFIRKHNVLPPLLRRQPGFLRPQPATKAAQKIRRAVKHAGFFI
jgi:hypothetical protein